LITIEENIVVHKLVFRLVGVALLTFGSLPLLAQDFSAEMVRLKPANAIKAKVYAHDYKMRFEVTNQQRSSVAIVDLGSHTTLMIIPDNKSYVKSPHVNASIPFFHITDVENACPAWEKTLEKPGTCTKVGDETINGRHAVKYKGTAADGDTGYAWVDRNLKTVIKWEGERGAAELQNIQEGPQAAALFQVPEGYQMFDLAAAQDAARAKNKSKTPHPRPASPAH
jgi:hypothetical protein